MKIAVSFLLLSASALVGSAFGEEVLFFPEMERSQFEARFGSPDKYFSSKANKYFTQSEYASALRVYGIVASVYYRKTKTNEYEIRIYFGLDDSVSRLHPKSVTRTAEMIVDQPKATFEILGDLAEAKTLCMHGCKLMGSSFAGPRIVIFPKDAKGDTCLGIELSNEEWNTFEKRKIKWLEEPITDIRLHLIDPGTIFKYDGGPPTDLGIWSPSRQEQQHVK